MTKKRKKIRKKLKEKKMCIPGLVIISQCIDAFSQAE